MAEQLSTSRSLDVCHANRSCAVLCCAVKEQGLDTTGLTETANFGLPDGSLDTGSALEPFDWSAAPAVPEPVQDLKQDPWDCWTVPEEVMTCQRDAPEPLRVTPTRSG